MNSVQRQSRPLIAFIRQSVQNAVIPERRAYDMSQVSVVEPFLHPIFSFGGSVSHHHRPHRSPTFGAERGHPRAARIRCRKCQSPSPNMLISGARRRTVLHPRGSPGGSACNPEVNLSGGAHTTSTVSTNANFFVVFRLAVGCMHWGRGGLDRPSPGTLQPSDATVGEHLPGVPQEMNEHNPAVGIALAICTHIPSDIKVN